MYICVSILIIYLDKGMLTPNSLRRLESGSVVTTAGKMFISTGAQQLSQTLSPSNLVESQVVKPGIRIRIILTRKSEFSGYWGSKRKGNHPRRPLIQLKNNTDNLIFFHSLSQKKEQLHIPS